MKLVNSKKLLMAVSAVFLLGGVGCGSDDDRDDSSDVITGTPTGDADVTTPARHFTCQATGDRGTELGDLFDLHMSADGTQVTVGTQDGGAVFARHDIQDSSGEDVSDASMVEYRNDVSNTPDELLIAKSLVNGTTQSGRIEFRGTEFDCNLN